MHIWINIYNILHFIIFLTYTKYIISRDTVVAHGLRIYPTFLILKVHTKPSGLNETHFIAAECIRCIRDRICRARTLFVPATWFPRSPCARNVYFWLCAHHDTHVSLWRVRVNPKWQFGVLLPVQSSVCCVYHWCGEQTERGRATQKRTTRERLWWRRVEYCAQCCVSVLCVRLKEEQRARCIQARCAHNSSAHAITT